VNWPCAANSKALAVAVIAPSPHPWTDLWRVFAQRSAFLGSCWYRFLYRGWNHPKTAMLGREWAFQAQRAYYYNLHFVETIASTPNKFCTVTKPFLLFDLAREYRSRRWVWSTVVRQPSAVYDTHRRTKLTTPETISRFRDIVGATSEFKKGKDSNSSTPNFTPSVQRVAPSESPLSNRNTGVCSYGSIYFILFYMYGRP